MGKSLLIQNKFYSAAAMIAHTGLDGWSIFIILLSSFSFRNVHFAVGEAVAGSNGSRARAHRLLP